MDPKLRKMLGKDGSFGEEDPRPRPMVDGAKAGNGGVKVTVAEIPPDLPTQPRRYPFRIEGTAPRGVILTDLTTLLEARFQGDPKFNLRHSQDEAVKRLKERMEQRLEKLKAAEDRAEEHAKGLEAKREAYEATKEEIKSEALKDLTAKREDLNRDIVQAENKAVALRKEIQDLRENLDTATLAAEDRKKALAVAQDRVLKSMGTDALDEPWLSQEQAGDMAEDLIHAWRELMADPDEPMASEYEDLAAMLAKVLVKTVGRVNDRWRDSGRQEPVVVEKPKDPPKRSTKTDLLF